MNIVLMVAILVISTTSVYAQDQANVAKLKADAENVVKIVSSDKRKLQTYCEFADLSDQSTKLIRNKTLRKLRSYPRKSTSWGENWVLNSSHWLTP